MAIICRSAAEITNINNIEKKTKKNCTPEQRAIYVHAFYSSIFCARVSIAQSNVVMLLVDTILKPKLMTLLPKMCKSTMRSYCCYFFFYLSFGCFLMQARIRFYLIEMKTAWVPQANRPEKPSQTKCFCQSNAYLYLLWYSCTCNKQIITFMPSKKN